MAVDRTGGTGDATVEAVEKQSAAEHPPPPDRPGAEGALSRAESRAAAAGQVNDQSTDNEPGKQKSEASPIPRESSSEQDTEAAQDTVAISESAEPATEEAGEQTETPSDETTGEDEGTEQPAILTETGTAGEGAGEPDDSGSVDETVAHPEPERGEEAIVDEQLAASDAETDGVRDDPVDVEGEARDGDRQMAGTPDAGAEEQPLERSDKPHEVKPPQIVGDYYPDIPPTAQDRYPVRDQSNPVPVFDGSPTRDQVVQGRIGDCGIVATLGSVAEHRPDAIKDAIKQVGDGEYLITLHEITEATPADPVARPTGDVKTYRVNDELPVSTDNPTRPPAGIQAKSCGWPALMEKVIAAEDQTWDTSKEADWDQTWSTWHKPAVDRDRANAGLGPSPSDAPTGYNRLDIGSTAYQGADVLAKLTGEEAEVRRIPGEQQGEQALLDSFRDQLSAGKPVLVGTRGRRLPTEQFPDGIYAGHAYEVTKVENDKIHMRNPWGRRHPNPMDAGTFWEYYRRYSYDGTRDGHYTTLK